MHTLIKIRNFVLLCIEARGKTTFSLNTVLLFIVEANTRFVLSWNSYSQPFNKIFSKEKQNPVTMTLNMDHVIMGGKKQLKQYK